MKGNENRYNLNEHRVLSPLYSERDYSQQVIKNVMNDIISCKEVLKEVQTDIQYVLDLQKQFLAESRAEFQNNNNNNNNNNDNNDNNNDNNVEEEDRINQKQNDQNEQQDVFINIIKSKRIAILNEFERKLMGCQIKINEEIQFFNPFESIATEVLSEQVGDNMQRNVLQQLKSLNEKKQINQDKSKNKQKAKLNVDMQSQFDIVNYCYYYDYYLEYKNYIMFQYNKLILMMVCLSLTFIAQDKICLLLTIALTLLHLCIYLINQYIDLTQKTIIKYNFNYSIITVSITIIEIAYFILEDFPHISLNPNVQALLEESQYPFLFQDNLNPSYNIREINFIRFSQNLSKPLQQFKHHFLVFIIILINLKLLGNSYLKKKQFNLKQDEQQSLYSQVDKKDDDVKKVNKQQQEEGEYQQQPNEEQQDEGYKDQLILIE